MNNGLRSTPEVPAPDVKATPTQSGESAEGNDAGRGLGTMPTGDPRDQRLREAVAWKLARFFWLLRLERIGNHFEDVAWCGKQWLGRKYPPKPDPWGEQ